MKMTLMATKLFLLLLVNLTRSTESKLGHFQAFDLNKILEGLKNINSTTPCGLHIKEYLHGLTSEKLWAQKMYDSSANTLHGVYMGNNKFLGHYDECLSVNHPENVFEGQHCVLNIDIFDDQHGLPILHQNNFELKFSSKYFSLLYGICIPSTCTPRETEEALKKWFHETSENGSIYIKLEEHNCYSTMSVRSKEINWIFKSFVTIIGLFALISTIYDITQRFYYKTDRPYNLFLAFSVYTNLSNMFCDNGNDLKMVNGLKAIASMLVIVSHSTMFVWMGPVENSKYGEEFLENFGFLNHNVVTEGLFFLSGFLTSEYFCRELAKTGSYDFTRPLIKKYIWITLVLSIIRLFNGWVFLSLGSGPLWNFLNKEECESCREGWISALLHSWNYLNPWQLCMKTTWSLNIHFHHIWLSPLVLIPTMHYPNWARSYLTILIAIAISISFAVNYTHGLRPFLKYALEGWAVEFIPTHTKMTSWLIGILFGYEWKALCEKKYGVKWSKFQKTMGWITSWICFLTGLLGSYILKDDENFSYLQGALHLSLQKVFFVLWVAWIIFACNEGFAGPINALLTSRLLQFLAKISVWVFLIHCSVLAYIIGIKKTNYIGLFEQINNLCTSIILTVIMATVLKMFIEMPAIVISKHIQQKMKMLPIYKPVVQKFKQEKEKKN